MIANEGERAEPDASAVRPTVPGEVVPDTPLSALNLNWREADLPERLRTKHVHRLHPYLGKFIPQLVEVFLRKYFQPGQTVLDPFCGSGTTLVQANELGIHAVGYDISAFNVLLCRAKTATYDIELLRHEIVNIIQRVRAEVPPGSSPSSLAVATEAAASDSAKYLTQWFAPAALSQLLSYRNLISSERYVYKDVLRIILSRSARSARLTAHHDLDFPKQPRTAPYWCHKHSRQCSPTTDALGFLERYSIDTLNRIEAFTRLRTGAQVAVWHADSTQVCFPHVDGVITSPPYVGLIDYHEQHAYAYHLLGLEDNREKEIGSAASGASQKAQRRYQENIAGVFSRAACAMPAGGRMIVVAGDRADLYGEIAKLAGMDNEATLYRQVNRRTGRRSRDFYESIFIWRKP